MIIIMEELDWRRSVLWDYPDTIDLNARVKSVLGNMRPDLQKIPFFMGMSAEQQNALHQTFLNSSFIKRNKSYLYIYHLLCI
jgi:hypothetical protein